QTALRSSRLPRRFLPGAGIGVHVAPQIFPGRVGARPAELYRRVQFGLDARLQRGEVLVGDQALLAQPVALDGDRIAIAPVGDLFRVAFAAERAETVGVVGIAVGH